MIYKDKVKLCLRLSISFGFEFLIPKVLDTTPQILFFIIFSPCAHTVQYYYYHPYIIRDLDHLLYSHDPISNSRKI